ncbi:MAG: hypothetical protein AAF986_03570 [Pseudomonadota bacterium]
MLEWLQEQAVFFAIFIAWFVGFYIAVIGVERLLKTFWSAKWSDHRKAAVLLVAQLALFPAILIASQTFWAMLVVFALAPLACWKGAHDEKEFRD